jgi:molybdopterin/thiamine biosynthesis adenylyltransferase
MPPLTSHQIERYSRQILLPEIGGTGQSTLLGAKVLVIGAGGLGSPVLYYLAAAGIGTLGVVDHDVVELSNLQRQILHDDTALGKLKAENAKATLQRVNPKLTFHSHACKLTHENATTLFLAYDVIVDGSDNVTTRYLVNDTCLALKKPLISGAVKGFSGQLYVFDARNADSPCYRCLYPDVPGDAELSCTRSGVLGSVAGTIGSQMATEVVKMLLGIADTRKIAVMDFKENRFTTLRLAKDPECLCHTHAKQDVA